MSRAETLAGLAEAIAGHEDYYWNRETHTTHCDCGHKHGEGLMVTGVAAIHRAHVAAVALAWLEGHGWAEATPVWAEGLENDGVHEFSDAYDCDGTFIRRWKRTPERHVKYSAWAPVETGEAT